jgi:hypothetical protein
MGAIISPVSILNSTKSAALGPALIPAFVGPAATLIGARLAANRRATSSHRDGMGEPIAFLTTGGKCQLKR